MQLTWLFFFFLVLGERKRDKKWEWGYLLKNSHNKISDNRIEMHMMFAVAIFPQIFSAFVRRLQKLIMLEAGFLFQLYKVISLARIPIKI